MSAAITFPIPRTYSHATALALAEMLRRVMGVTAQALPDLAPFDAPPAVRQAWDVLDEAERLLRHHGLDHHSLAVRQRQRECRRCKLLAEAHEYGRKSALTFDDDECARLEVAEYAAFEAATREPACQACAEES